MKSYEVTFEIFLANGGKTYETVTIEAGNKRYAAVRAMMEVNKNKECAQLFKNLVSVREVK